MEIYSNMTEVTNNQNLNSYYSTKAKAERKKGVVAQPPASVPTKKIYSDIEANQKFAEINQDIYQDSKKSNRKEKIKILKVIGGILAAALVLAGGRKLISVFKKS